MELTITAKLQIYPTTEQHILLSETGRAFSRACNHVSDIVFDTHNLNQNKLQKETYTILRNDYNMPSQIACNIIRHVIGSYRTILTNQKEWIKPNYKHGAYILSWNRDYSLTQNLFSLNTLRGRIKVPYANHAMQQYFDGSWQFGTAKVINKHGKWYLHIAVNKDIPQLTQENICNVVGVDMGINFTATSYDSKGNTAFYSGKHIKHKRAHYKALRKQLQQCKTPSARRRLKAIGSRENRWVQDINHCVSKALIDSNPKGTLFVLEDLTGIRNVTERVRVEDRYVQVSWPYFDLRKKLEYKAMLYGDKVITVSPKHTSQCCPKCGHTEASNRNKKLHIFKCKACGYTSNDDRIGAMNLHRKGIEYLTGAVNMEHDSILKVAVSQPKCNASAVRHNKGGRSNKPLYHRAVTSPRL